MITLEDARNVIAAAEKKAKELRQPMNIAVADGGGNLVAHVRMDDAWLGSIDIAIKKAFTSRAFNISTRDLAQHSQSGGEFFGIDPTFRVGYAQTWQASIQDRWTVRPLASRLPHANISRREGFSRTIS